MERPPTALRRARAWPWIVAALAAAVAAVLIAAPPPDRPPDGRGDPSRGAGEPEAAAAAEAPRSPAALDPLALSALLDGISADRLVRGLLADSGWIARWAAVTEQLAEGTIPRRELASAAPRGPFSVERVGRETVIAAASYRRYDGFAEAVGSVSAVAVAALYRAVHGPVQSAYRALGYPSAPFDPVIARALHRIEAAPVVDGDVLVRAEGGLFVFADERLERLGDVEKLFLRMGQRNARLVQAKATEIREALGLPAPERTALR